ncbi:MAG: TAXI family TRAP transporter solute-binding subunit [Acidobacteriota bacterium]
MVAASLVAASCNDCAFGVARDTRLTLAAGPPETAAACVARAFTSRLNEEHPDQHAGVLRTNGAVDSLIALRDGRADLAVAEADTLAQAVNGEGPFEGRTASARTIATLYTSRLYLIVPEQSEINGFSQLRGQKLGTGPDGSGMTLTLDRALDAGLLRGWVSVESHSWPDLMQAFADGRVGAVAWLDGLSSPALAGVAAGTHPGFRILGSGSVVPLLERKYGQSLYQQSEIPGGAYGTGEPVESVGVSAVLVARHDLDERTAFAVANALFRMSSALASACPAISGLTPSAAARSQPAALHAGAALFYRETNDEFRRSR